MTFGKLFTIPDNPRTTAVLAVAKANGLDLDVVHIDFSNITEEHRKANKQGKVPTFIGSDGFVLTECIALAIYITSQNEKTTLLGKTKQDYASILKWMSFFNQEILGSLGAWYLPLLGRGTYNKKAIDEHAKKTLSLFDIVEEYLLHNTFLVGERITLADLFCAGLASRGFQFFFDKTWRQEHPNVTRWWTTVTAQPIYAAVGPKITLLEKPALTNTPPKVEQKKEEPKAAVKAAPKAVAAEPAEPAPKPKHACELLPKPSVPLDEWKRYYSNHETPEAMKWFWENIKFDEYSLWKVEFMYNEDLTLPFMSNNQIGGFFTRLEASRKYVFGCASVYGEANNSVIQGAFVIRGQDHEPVFEAAPDWTSYKFIKLDPTSEEDRKFVEDEWSWERPLTINGKEYPHLDGKVCK